jgi:hypothetical protein
LVNIAIKLWWRHRSYADDEDCLVTDPNLAEHLSFWGIDIMKLEKTDKTLGVRFKYRDFLYHERKKEFQISVYQFLFLFILGDGSEYKHELQLV